jgi:hypothetical protein
MLLRAFPDVHVRRLCITVLISSSNPVAVIRCVSLDKRSKAAATAASPDPAQAGSALCVHFSRGVKNAGW